MPSIINIEGLLRKQLEDEKITTTELRQLSRVIRIARDQDVLLQIFSADSARKALNTQVRFKDAATAAQIKAYIGERQGLGAFGFLRNYARQEFAHLELKGLIDPHELYSQMGQLLDEKRMSSEARVEQLYRIISPTKMEETTLHEGLHGVWFRQMTQEDKAPFLKQAEEELNRGWYSWMWGKPTGDVAALAAKHQLYARNIQMARGKTVGFENPMVEWVANELFAHRGAATEYDTSAEYRFAENEKLDKSVRRFMQTPRRPTKLNISPEYVGTDPVRAVAGTLDAVRFRQSAVKAQQTLLPSGFGIAFNRAINPIEGMQKGGLAEYRRKAMTDFGSPYRRHRTGGRPLPTFMEEALQRSVILDVETAGLEPGKRTPLSAATMKYTDPSATTTFFEPEVAMRVPSGRKYARLKDKQQFLRRMQPWPRKMWEKYWGPERARHLAQGGQLERPGQFFSELATKTADAGNILWAHNVHFDVTGWASQYMSPDAMGKYFESSVIPPWYPMDPRRGKIFPTLTPAAWKYRRRAAEFPGTAPGSMRGFYGEFRTTLKQAVETGKPMVADTMMVAQSVMGMGQGAGYMGETGDVFTGSGLESLHQAYFGEGYQAHLAKADVEAARRLMPELLGTAEALYAGDPLRGREARALYRLGAMQPGLAEQNVERTFAQARQGIVKEGRYALHSRQGRQVFSTDYQDILRVYEERFAKLSYPEMPSVKSIWDRVGLMEEAALDTMMAAEKQLPKLGLATRIGAQARYAKAEAQYFAGKVPRPLLYGVAAVGAAAGLAYLARPGTKEEANTIPGLPKGGIADFKRRIITDFGSGYRSVSWWKQLPARWNKVRDWFSDWINEGLMGLGSSNMAYPAIDGLGEEGSAPGTRKFMTDFGSGWRGLVAVPARFMAGAGEAAAEFLTKGGLAEHIGNLKKELSVAETIANVGAEMKGSMAEVEMLELRQAISKLQSASGRKQGAVLIDTAEMASRDPHRVSRIKALISEERFHEAVANSPQMRDIIGQEGAVPMEWLMSMEAQSYNVPREVRSGLRSLSEAEEASIKFSWREEYFAKMAAMEVAGESMAVEDYLAMETYANDTNFEILKQHAKEYRMDAMEQNIRQQKHLKQINTARMTVKTMEKYAPLPITNIRMFDSPGVPGMVQRMSAAKRGSAKMYNH